MRSGLFRVKEFGCGKRMCDEHLSKKCMMSYQEEDHPYACKCRVYYTPKEITSCIECEDVVQSHNLKRNLIPLAIFLGFFATVFLVYGVLVLFNP